MSAANALSRRKYQQTTTMAMTTTTTKNTKKQVCKIQKQQHQKNVLGQNKPAADRKHVHKHAADYKFSCGMCGPNNFHNMEHCFKLKILARRGSGKSERKWSSQSKAILQAYLPHGNKCNGLLGWHE